MTDISLILNALNGEVLRLEGLRKSKPGAFASKPHPSPHKSGKRNLDSDVNVHAKELLGAVDGFAARLRKVVVNG